MFDKDFEIELHPTRAACARGFEKRCEVPSQIDRDLWRNAWHRFSTDSFGQIPPLKCIRLSNPDAKNELVLRRLRYRLLAVLHFLPKFKAKQSLVTGKALKSVRKIINLLEFWKQTLPPNTLVELPVKPRIILPKPDPAPPILLPLPPRFKKKHVDKTPTTQERARAEAATGGSASGGPVDTASDANRTFRLSDEYTDSLDDNQQEPFVGCE